MAGGAKHTPGPWEVERLEASNRLAVTARRSHTVAIMSRNVHIDETVHEANARLIAAAPDLLDALRHVYLVTDSPGSLTDEEISALDAWCGLDPNSTWGELVDAVRDRARAAIAKAT